MTDISSLRDIVPSTVGAGRHPEFDGYDPFHEALQNLTMRKAWAESLCYAISQCHPLDASQIMAAALEDMTIKTPELSAFWTITQEDADFWASFASQPELQVYAFAALKQLGKRALTPAIRRRFIAELWAGLDASDRAAFIARVAG